MRKYLFIPILLLSISLSAQEFQLQLGAKGGGATCLQTTPSLYTGMSMELGFLAPVGTINIGFRVGAEGGYITSSYHKDIEDKFTNYDHNRLELDYIVTGKLQQQQQQILLGVPLMLTGNVYGFVFSAGVRPTFSMLSSGTQDFTDMHTSVYYPDFDVYIDDEPVLGTLTEQQGHQERKDIAPKFNLLCGLELGYEWTLNERYHYRSSSSIYHHIGVVAYFDFSAYHTSIDVNENTTPFVHVSNINNNQTDAIVTIPFYAQTPAKYMDFGIRLYYSFSTPNNRIDLRRRWGLH